MLTVAIYIQDTYTSEYNRVDLFDDEKISVTSSIQNINDISKVTTDFSQTFTVPASVQNNKIFHHWYDNSNDNSFLTSVKSNAFIEIDTIPFRKGKIQLESANVVDGKPQNYSITFIGILGNLKDIFAGKFLKDLTLNTAYDGFNYTPTNVKDRVTNATSSDIMFPLISSVRNWNFFSGDTNNISDTSYPLRYNELFPALKLRAVLNMIETEFGINFDGTATEPSTFLNTDARFSNAYLYMKNAETFATVPQSTKQNFIIKSTPGSATNESGFEMDLATDRVSIFAIPSTIVIGTTTYNFLYRDASFAVITTNAGVPFTIAYYKNGVKFQEDAKVSTAGGYFSGNSIPQSILSSYGVSASTDYFECFIETSEPLTFESYFEGEARYQSSGGSTQVRYQRANSQGFPQTTPIYYLPIKKYFPEIKIEDFFSGLLKMFNLTCYSSDGINYTVEQLESYYGAGADVDITEYVIQDKKDLNRVKTYKKINFDYEKSDSFVNVAFNSNAGIEYGSLRYENSPPADGEEYSIKLPFEDLNFSNLGKNLQVGYCLKSDYQQYIPKPIILYDYTPTALSTSKEFYFSTARTGTASNFAITSYKAFGQETLISSVTYGLNFPTQQSTLTNEIVTKGLYDQYYSAYFANIYNYKARLIKVTALLPTSVLTSLELNDNIIIRDEKYIINTFTTNLTTGEVQFELLTDTRI